MTNRNPFVDFIESLDMDTSTLAAPEDCEPLNTASLLDDPYIIAPVLVSIGGIIIQYWAMSDGSLVPIDDIELDDD